MHKTKATSCQGKIEDISCEAAVCCTGPQIPSGRAAAANGDRHEVAGVKRARKGGFLVKASMATFMTMCAQDGGEACLSAPRKDLKGRTLAVVDAACLRALGGPPALDEHAQNLVDPSTEKRVEKTVTEASERWVRGSVVFRASCALSRSTRISRCWSGLNQMRDLEAVIHVQSETIDVKRITKFEVSVAPIAIRTSCAGHRGS